MRKFAIYGKGGIGKSTTTANLSAALSMMGKKVVQVGCDPKADSTLNLLHGEPVMPVMDYYRKYTEGPDFEHIGKEGFGGVFCIETGGPTPGLGCAGRGIIATFDLMDEQEVFQSSSLTSSCMMSWATSSVAVSPRLSVMVMPMKSLSSRPAKRWPLCSGQHHQSRREFQEPRLCPGQGHHPQPPQCRRRIRTGQGLRRRTRPAYRSRHSPEQGYPVL